MELIELKCNNCGAELEIDKESKQAFCQYCGAKLLIDDGIQHIQYDNMEQTGYDLEKGKLRAREEYEERVIQKQIERNMQVEQMRQVQLKEQKKQMDVNKTIYLFKQYWWLYALVFIVCYPISIIGLTIHSLGLHKKVITCILGIVSIISMICYWKLGLRIF